MPSGTHNYAPDLPTISSFFVDERIPDDWTNRATPYSLVDVGLEIITMYAENPVLFGGNTAAGSFNGLNWGPIKNGRLPVDFTPAETTCLLYQIATGQLPDTLNGVLTPTVESLAFAATKLDLVFQNLGCLIVLT